MSERCPVCENEYAARLQRDQPATFEEEIVGTVCVRGTESTAGYEVILHG